MNVWMNVLGQKGDLLGRKCYIPQYQLQVTDVRATAQSNYKLGVSAVC